MTWTSSEIFFYSLSNWIDENFSDSFTRKRSIQCSRLQHAIAAIAPKCIGSIVVGGNKTGLGDPVDRFQLLRGDECLRTRKQTHQLHVHVRQNHQRHKQQSERAVPCHNTCLTHRYVFIFKFLTRDRIKGYFWFIVNSLLWFLYFSIIISLIFNDIWHIIYNDI